MKKFHISKEQILKQVQSTFEKKEVLCRQVLETVSTQINTKKQSINKAKTFIKDNHQGVQDYLFSVIKDKDVLNKFQSTLKKNPIVKNVMEYGDKYIGHYIEIFNNPQTKNAIHKPSQKKVSSSRQDADPTSHLKPPIKKKLRKSTRKKINLTEK